MRAVLVVIERDEGVRPGIVPIVGVVCHAIFAIATIGISQGRMFPIVAGILPRDYNALPGDTHFPDLVGLHLLDVPANALTLFRAAIAGAEAACRVRLYIRIEHHLRHAR